MNARSKASIVNQIKQVIEGLEKPFSGKLLDPITSPGDGSFSMTGDTLEKYNQIIALLMNKEGWGKKYSEVYIDEAIKNLMATILKEGNITNLAEYFDALTVEFEDFSEEQIVFIVLSGIEMEMDELEVGNITLRNKGASQVEAIEGQIKSLIMSTNHTDQEKDFIFAMQKETVLNNIKDRVCAEYRVIGEPKRAKERAEEEVRRVIDLIWYAIAGLYPEERRVAVGLQGEDGFWRTIPVLSVKGDNFNSQGDWIGRLNSFEFSSARMEALKEIGFFDAADLLKNDKELNDFEKTLLRGIHWFSTSQTQVEKENAFLNLTTCLEVFFTPLERDPIAVAIAEGVALVLETDLDSRKSLKKRVKNLYGQRSGVSHGGNKSILNSDLAELKIKAGSVIMWMIHHKNQFSSKAMFLEWLEDQKLA